MATSLAASRKQKLAIFMHMLGINPCVADGSRNRTYMASFGAERKGCRAEKQRTEHLSSESSDGEVDHVASSNAGYARVEIYSPYARNFFPKRKNTSRISVCKDVL